jgi:gluconate 2-dehydrogenase gamma chain
MHESDARPPADRAGRLSRREVIGRGTALGLVMAIPAAGTATLERALAAPTAKAALTAQQSAVLNALVARLVPADANGPNGADAGAAAYIERALKGALKDVAPLYDGSLAAVDAYAAATHGAAFTALPPAAQDAVIADIESGKATGFAAGSATFFLALKEHTLQGMFSDPVYGGNKAFAGWNLLGYPGVRMPVQVRHQKLDVTVPAAHKSTYADGQFAAARKEAQG